MAQKLTEEIMLNARDHCRPLIDAFVECARRERMMVVVRCGQHNDDSKLVVVANFDIVLNSVNACVRPYGSAEFVEIYKRFRAEEIPEVEIVKSKKK